MVISIEQNISSFTSCHLLRSKPFLQPQFQFFQMLLARFMQIREETNQELLFVYGNIAVELVLINS